MAAAQATDLSYSRGEVISLPVPDVPTAVFVELTSMLLITPLAFTSATHAAGCVIQL
jgi:hypothetical protein